MDTIEKKFVPKEVLIEIWESSRYNKINRHIINQRYPFDYMGTLWDGCPRTNSSVIWINFDPPYEGWDRAAIILHEKRLVMINEYYKQHFPMIIKMARKNHYNFGIYLDYYFY